MYVPTGCRHFLKIAARIMLAGGVGPSACAVSSAQDTQRPFTVIVVAQAQRSISQHDFAVQRYERGIEAAKAGDFQEAIQLFSLALAVSRALSVDELGQLYRARADAYAKTGDFEAALADAGRGIQVSSNRILKSFLHALRGTIYLKMNFYDKAEVELNTSISLNPSNAQNFETRAFVRYREHKLKSALMDYETAFLLDPSMQRAKHNFSEIERQLANADNHAQQAEAPHDGDLAKSSVLPPE